jgi:predicted Fe-Mo cluster-binding NifX family protein
MKTACTLWNNRISPLFDVAREAVVINEDQEIHLELAASPDAKLRQLLQEGVERLICGAVSRCVQRQLESAGIEVIPFVCGSWEEIKKAWKEEQLDQLSFTMPGCRRCRRRNHQQNRGG